MVRRLGLGPVFAFEWLMTARRWQAYAMRSATVGLLLGAMTLIWMESPASWASSEYVTIQRQAQIGRSFFGVTSMILLGLVGLAAPAATAGSICLDKARGNLTLLFATDLSNREIVLGKLAAKLVPVVGLILCATPVLAIATLFGGIDPAGLSGTILVLLGVAVFGCSLALTLSVWGRKTHEVLMATYVLGILYLLLPIILGGAFGFGAWGGISPLLLRAYEELCRMNPVFLVVSTLEAPPGWRPITFWTHAQFLMVGLLVSGGMLGLSTWRIRSVVVRQLGQGAGSGRRARRRAGPGWLAGLLASERFGRVAPGTAGLARRLARVVGRLRRGPSLDRNPVYWRECHRKRLSGFSLFSWGIYILLCGGFSLYAIFWMLVGDRWYTGRGVGLFVNVVQVPLGLLLLSVSSATSLAEERQRGSLDVLLATPMSTRSIVWGKWLGTFRSVPRLLVFPTAVALAHATYSGLYWAVPLLSGLILAYGAAITSLGLLLATWTSRMGRAVGMTTGIYVMMCIAWPFLSILVFSTGPGESGLGVAAGSPFLGIGVLNALIADEGPRMELHSQTLWTLFWTIAYLGIAFMLLLVTMGSFNRFLGRIDDLSAWDSGDESPRPAGAAPDVERSGPEPRPEPSKAGADPVASEG